jgi:aryl-alcohol dehydrogenase-like predicted oxidoreductase
MATATASGTFKIGGDLEVTRLGYGAMRITGKGIWGPPADRDAALAVLRRLPELGVDFIDTADSYGPYVSEDLIAEALAPYDGMVVATKAGLCRTGPASGRRSAGPEYLRQCLEMSLRRLQLDVIPLWQLHRIDAQVPREEQFGVLKEAVDEGKVRHVGLSEVSVEEIKAAQEIVPVATVQNLYNLTNRKAEDVLAYCEEQGIGFIPWFPLAAGDLAKPGGPVAQAAERHGATAGRSRWPGSCTARPSCSRSPGRARSSTSRRTSRPPSSQLTEDELAAIEARRGLAARTPCGADAGEDRRVVASRGTSPRA